MFITTDGRSVSVDVLGENRIRVRVGSSDGEQPLVEHDLTAAEARHILTTRPPDPTDSRAGWLPLPGVPLASPDAADFAQHLAAGVTESDHQ